MWFFKKLVWGIVAIIFCIVLRVVLDKTFPYSILFHKNLLLCVEIFIVLWLFAYLIIGLLLKRSRFFTRAGLISFITLIIILTAGEIVSLWFIKHPQKIPKSLLVGYKYFYLHHYRKVIQISPECCQYDSAFFYGFKPNQSCSFSNVEFSNVYKTNKAGYRDNDSSLLKPQIICLGDSYMMGWGINQDETISEILKKETGKRVINTGMSSFGTARELKRLNYLDTSALEYIVLQYCLNDNEENKAFLDNGGVLKISSKASYDSLKTKDDWNRFYFPGKCVLLSGKYLFTEKLRALLGKPPSYIGVPLDFPKDAKMFLDVLTKGPVNFSKTKVIAFVANDMQNHFLNEVKKLLQQSSYQEYFKGNLQLIDISALIDAKNDFYILDDHCKASLHKKIAEEIVKYIH